MPLFFQEMGTRTRSQAGTSGANEAVAEGGKRCVDRSQTGPHRSGIIAHVASVSFKGLRGLL